MASKQERRQFHEDIEAGTRVVGSENMANAIS